MTPAPFVRTLVALAFLASAALAATPLPQPVPSESLTQAVTSAVRAVQSGHPEYDLRDDQIAVTLIDLSDPASPSLGHFRGDQLIYPASVVKLFYLAYAHQLVADGRLQDTPELRRGLREMIVNSDNDATAYVLYAVTDAPNGAELPEREMAEWSHKRNAVNRYFASLGYPKINACQCTYSFGPFGRERVFLGEKYTNRNMLTTSATSLLMYHIATGRAVSPESSEAMLALLERKRTATKPANPDDQAHGFTGASLPEGWKLFSKAGWTSTARHDTALVESPDGRTRFILTTFTTGQAKRRDVIPSVLTHVLARLRPDGSTAQ